MEVIIDLTKVSNFFFFLNLMPLLTFLVLKILSFWSLNYIPSKKNSFELFSSLLTFLSPSFSCLQIALVIYSNYIILLYYVFLNSRNFRDFHLCICSQNTSPRFYMGIFLLLIGDLYCFNTHSIFLVCHFISYSTFSSAVIVFPGQWLFPLFTRPCTKLTVCIDVLEIMMY